MNKRVFSLILAVCMLLNIPVVFAENDLQIKTESGTINMSAITDENVLYKAMQNKNGIASIKTDSNDPMANFDVVLGFDVPDTYDYSGEKAWLEQFRVLQEQAPKDTRFAVVTDEAGEFSDIDEAIDIIKANGTSSTIAMSDLVDSIIDTFDRQSKKRTKVAIMAVGDTDAAALQSEMDKLRGEDIIPFAFVLNSDPTNNSKNFDGVYKCSSDLELRLNIADLYLSFGEFNEAVIPISKKDSKEVSSWCDSDFKKNHLTDTTVTAGSAMTSVLNMYKCLPIKAVYEDYNYNLSDGIENVEALIDFLKGNGTAINASSAFELWDAVYNNLAITDSADVGNPTNYENIIDKNLKRRFPVVANVNGNISIISSYEPNTREIKVNAEDTSVPLDDIVSIVDTYEYLMTVSISSKRVTSDVSQKNTSITIKKEYATDYSVADNVYIIPESIDKLSTKVGKVLSFAADLVQYSAKEFVVVATTNFDKNIPSIYDPMPFYKLKFYNDVLSSDEWYYDYLLKATSLGIIEGDENGNFLGNDSVTRCQFIRMALQAAQIPLKSEDPKWHTDHWAIDYMNKANELGILFWDDTRSDDEIAEYFDEAIPRYEAAYILKTLLMDKRDNIKVPTLLYEYAPNSTTLQGKAWTEKSVGQFNGDTVRAEEAMYQLFMNSILVGDEHGNLKIKEKISRSEVVKLIIKPLLLEFDENVPQLFVNIFDDDKNEYTDIELDGYGKTLDNIVFDNNGERTFTFTIKEGDTYRYLIETTDGGTDNNITLSVSGGETYATNKYHVEGAGTYTITIKNTGDNSVGMHIQAICAPQDVVFSKLETDENGKNHYYIYDDNHERIRDCDLADGATPTTIAHFENLEPGIYTFFGYHNRDHSAGDAVYYEPVFWTEDENGGTIDIRKIGYSTKWDWNQVWADFSGENVYIDKGKYITGKLTAPNPNEDIIVKTPEAASYKLPEGVKIRKGTKTWFSQFLASNQINRIYNADANGTAAIWVMLEFEITEGRVNFATVAYSNANTKDEIDITEIDKGKYEVDRQYKGISCNSPDVYAHLEYYIGNL